jgi:hypothetical protein
MKRRRTPQKMSRRPNSRAGALHGLACILGLAAAMGLPTGPAAAAADDLSAAEKALFMSRQLANISPPAILRYTFRKTGSLEDGFVDTVAVALSAQPGGGCCSASGQFLSGERQVALPDIDDAQGNPVILYFLEHDIREMKRLTQGAQNYFRKRIRMSVFQGATLTPVSLRYRGRDVAGQEVAITPYADDPNRYRFEKLAGKEYRFLLSDAVPGGVYGIRTQVASGGASLITEEMFIEGAEPVPSPGRAVRAP